MLSRKLSLLFFCVLILIAATAFLGVKPTPYKFILPPSLPKNHEPPENPTTYEGVVLGERLFYDKYLSKDNAISCASCHKQAFGFGDSTAYSKGIGGRLSKRNTLPLFNLAWQYQFFWDGRITSLEELIMHPLTNSDEMATDTSTLPQKLSQIPDYPPMFEAAFGSKRISNKKIAMAISQFLRTLVSYEAKLDTIYEYLNPLVTNEQRRDVGKLLGYTANVSQVLMLCEKCHNGESYGGIQLKNNGLDVEYEDTGNKKFNENKAVLFKVPSLRNLKLTAPYMHDGRFQTLEEVLEHYSSGIQPNPDLSPELIDANGNPIRLNLTDEDKYQIIEFLTYANDFSFSSKKTHKE